MGTVFLKITPPLFYKNFAISYLKFVYDIDKTNFG